MKKSVNDIYNLVDDTLELDDTKRLIYELEDLVELKEQEAEKQYTKEQAQAELINIV